MKRLLLTLGVMALTGTLLTTNALARTDCNGVLTGTITGGINVTGACILDHVTLTGGIKMATGTLEACGSTISGGVHVTGGTCVSLGLGSDDTPTAPCNHDPDTISGDVSIDNVTGDNGGATCPATANFEAEGSTISGGVSADDSGSLELEANTIIGTVHVNDNTSAELDSNSITGSLLCSGNGVVNGFLNTVTGTKHGQCTGI